MPRAKKTIKEVQVVGPVLIVDGVEIVSFKTEFKAEKDAGFDQSDLSSVALKHHSDFIEHVTATISEAAAKPATKEKPAQTST